MEKGKSNTILLTVIGIATLLVAVVGATFAFFSAQISGQESASTLTIVAGEGGSVAIEGGDSIQVNNIYPRTAAWAVQSFAVTYTQGATSVPVAKNHFYRWDLNYDNQFPATYLKYQVIEGGCTLNNKETQAECQSASGVWRTNSNKVAGTTVTSETDMPTGTGKVTGVIRGGFDIAGQTFESATPFKHYYSFILRFPDNGADQNGGQNKSWSGNLQEVTISTLSE